MPHLGVNVDHVATVRQARGGAFPDPVQAALISERAGASSVVAHLREDRRHIQDADLFRLKRKLRTKLNVEMSVEASVVKTALRVRPHIVTFVPERRRERTTESGLDVFSGGMRLEEVTRRFHARNVGVSFFLDPDSDSILAARALGADAVEIHTGAYANAQTAALREKLARKVEGGVLLIRALGMKAHVGHGLDYENTPRIARIRGISDFNIGYAIISRALFVGIGAAVRDMKRKISG